MNYLAHFHLSYGDQDLLVGALLGEFIKGRLCGNYPEKIEQGILLHRKIDAFTDTNSILKECHKSFDPKFYRYAGIMTDVVFDYFLTKHWAHFHDSHIEQFGDDIYSVIVDHPTLTVAANQQAKRLADYQVLTRYDNWKIVNNTLIKLGERLTRDNPLYLAGEEVEKHKFEIEEAFLAFYPALQIFVTKQRQHFTSINAVPRKN